MAHVCFHVNPWTPKARGCKSRLGMAYGDPNREVIAAFVRRAPQPGDERGIIIYKNSE